jgi:hypothetical protein
MKSRRVPVLSLLSLVVALAITGACSRQDPTTLEPDEGYPVRFADNRPLVSDVTQLTLDPTPGGAILRVTGVTATQGWWDIALRREVGTNDTTGERRYVLRGWPPVDATGAPIPAPTGPTALREVGAALFLSDSDLGDLRRITVTGANTSRTLSR